MRSRSWSIRRTTGSGRSRSRTSGRSGNPPRRATSRAGTRCVRSGRMRRSCCSARAPIRARSTTSRRRWSGKAKSSRGDYTASEDDNVLVQGVEHNKNALGYFGFAYYISHKERMRAVPIATEGGGSVAPSMETVTTARYQPLSRPLFIYVKRRGGAAAGGAEVHRVLSDAGPRARGGGRFCAIAAAGIADRARAFSARAARHCLRRFRRSA